MCVDRSKSDFFRQFLDMMSKNSAALGAAILAAVGCGVYPSVVDAESESKYDKVYNEFDALYPKLKDNFKSILDL